MGLFSGITKVFKKATKVVKRVATGVATGGISEIARLAGQKSLATKLESSFFPTSPAAVLRTGLAVTTGQPLLLAQGAPMAFNLGQFAGGVGQILGGSSNPYLSGVGQIAGAFGTSLAKTQAIPVASRAPSAPSVSLPAVMARGVPMTGEIGRAAMKLLARLGIPTPMSIPALASALKRVLGGITALARRTPAGSIVSMLIGLGLTAAETSLLVGWYAQKKKVRRMNPANSKALRRAVRRIRSFHRLCGEADIIRRRAPRKACRTPC